MFLSARDLRSAAEPAALPDGDVLLFPRRGDFARDVILWAALAGILTALFLMFRAFVIREIAWAYPANYDQTKYLEISYAAYEAALRDGLARSVKGLLQTPYQNGMLMHLEALALMLPFGASRLTVLSVNFLTLAVYVLVMAAAARAVTNSRRMALLAAGLAFGTGPYWFRNQVDYRLDFSSVCIFGVFVSVVIRSGVFRSRNWSFVAGPVAGLLVANRFLTALYVAGIYGGMLVYFGVVAPWLQKRPAGLQFRNAALSALLGAAVSAPVIWVSGQAIYDYYVVEQGLQRAIRVAEFAVKGTLRSWFYYPVSALIDHAGLPFVLVSIAVLGISAVAAWSGRRRGRAVAPEPSTMLSDAAVFLTLSALVIIGLLNANITRSPVVGGTVVPAFSWAVVLAAYALLRPGLARGERWVCRAAALSAALALAVTTYSHVAFYTSHYVFWVNRSDSREIARMYREIGQHAEDLGWSAAIVGSDSVRDYLLAPAITAAHYEATGSLVTFSGVLGAGGGVRAQPRDVMLNQLARADFLMLTHRRDAAEQPYPLIDSLEGIRSDMEEAARSRLVRLGQYGIFGRRVDLYARPALRLVSGVSGGWITDDGLLVEVPGGVASMSPAELMITGGMNPWVGSDVAMTCLSGRDGSGPQLAASFVVRDNWYVGRCALPGGGTGQGPMHVRLSFSKYFVPREKGINDDVRRLVVAAPIRAEVVPRQPAQ